MPLPAIAQQFSNHGGQVAKVYVAGDKVSVLFFFASCLAHSDMQKHFSNHRGQVAKVYVAGDKVGVCFALLFFLSCTQTYTLFFPQVFHALRPSIPDITQVQLAHHLPSRSLLPSSAPSTPSAHASVPSAHTSLLQQHGFHVFDSLKSLPVASSPVQLSQEQQQQQKQATPSPSISLQQLLLSHEHVLQVRKREGGLHDKGQGLRAH